MALTRKKNTHHFYDVDHATRRLSVNLLAPELLDLIARKLAHSSDELVDVSRGRLERLRQRVDAELSPVLRPRDLEQFDLDRTFAAVAGVVAALELTR